MTCFLFFVNKNSNWILKIRITVNAKKFEETCNTVEKWYKCKYNVTKLTEEFIEKLINAPRHQDHHLPLPNPFIATDFNIKPLPDSANEHPYLISVSSTFLYDKLWVVLLDINETLMTKTAWKDQQLIVYSFKFLLLQQ